MRGIDTIKIHYIHVGNCQRTNFKRTLKKKRISHYELLPPSESLLKLKTPKVS